MMRLILISLFFLLATATAFADPIEDVRQAECRLGDCWQELFPKIRQTIEGGAKIVEAYQADFKAKMERAALLDRRAADAERLLLEYKLAILRHALDECDDLRDGPSRPRHIIIVGHHFDKDGENFRLAAMTRAQALVEQTCGKEDASTAFRQCRKSIVVITDTNKRDLLNYLSMLDRGSVRSLAYVGHGISNGLVLGPKDLLLPVTWQPELKLTEGDWRRRNLGMLYSSDLDGPLAATLVRVVAHGAPLDFFACDTGQDFAPSVKGLLPGSEVHAAPIGMHFEYLNAEGRWITDWEHPVPLNAIQTRLVPDADGMFGAIAPKPSAAPPPPEGNLSASPRPPRDTAARDIVLRLAINSASEAVVEHGKRLITFSDAERDRLREIMGPRVSGHVLADDSFGYDAINSLMREAREKTQSKATHELDQQLLDKINDAVAEAVALYY